MFRVKNKAIFCLALMLNCVAPPAAATAREDVHAPLAAPTDAYRVERVVMLYRHGLRAPLTGEIGAGKWAKGKWPVWATPNADLTPHGREGLRLMGRYDRGLFVQLGLFAKAGCPGPKTLNIYTDSDSRSMASGDEMREGMAPGCQIPTHHLPPGTSDLTFSGGAPGAAPFDPAQAASSIKTYIHGSQEAMLAPYGDAVERLQKVLGCAGSGCDLAHVPGEITTDAKGLHVSGPVMVMSGTAEVFLLQYAEGMPMQDVGWGRATPADLTAISVLHGIMFDIFDRSPYMARRTAAQMAPRIRDVLTSDASPKVQLFIGHDNNIAAMASLLGAKYHIPSYGPQDPPLGGGLGFELLVHKKTGEKFVRVFYQAQRLDQLRHLTKLDDAHPPVTMILKPACVKGPYQLCRLADFSRALSWPGQALWPLRHKG